MGLFLSVISYQQLSPDLQSKFTLEGASAVIGRSGTNDWVLPDNDKILSSRHAELTLVMDKYYITDVSTNGVFINQETKPLGKGNRHALISGDQIILGEYVIEVTIESELANDNEHFSDLKPESQQPIFSSTVDARFTATETPSSDRSVHSPSISDPFLAGSEMQDSLVLDSNFIPDDWNWDHDAQNSVMKKTVTQAQAQLATPAVHSEDSAIVENNTHDHIIAKQQRTVKPQSVSHTSLKASSSKSTAESTDNMVALLKGLGIDKSPVIDEEEWWFDLGASMRTINEELMSSLRDRAAFKNKFRVNHTMFQIKENNPFKFSASVDDLFRNLYLRSNGSFMSTNKAITEAFGDLRQHEQSMRAGLEGAVVGILEQLAPENMLEEQSEKGFFDKFKRANKELNMWRRFIEMHEDISNEITINRDSILSDAFVRAYEDKQKQG